MEEIKKPEASEAAKLMAGAVMRIMEQDRGELALRLDDYLSKPHLYTADKCAFFTLTGITLPAMMMSLGIPQNALPQRTDNQPEPPEAA